MILRFLVTLFVAGITPTLAQGITPDVDAMVEESMEALNIPGAAVVYIAPDGTVEMRGYGHTADPGTPITPSTAFQLGSVSKNFVALLVLQLAGEGALGLDDPVVQHIPTFSLAGGKGQSITIRQLISHHSGISIVDGNSAHHILRTDLEIVDERIERMKTFRPRSEPGEQYEYSNANYLLLAKIIEVVTQERFEDVIRSRIFEPLEMNDSSTHLDPAGNYALPHLDFFGTVRQLDENMGRHGLGSGGVMSSARDMATYLKAVQSRDPRILPANIADQFLTPFGGDAEGYAFGWTVIVRGDRIIAQHTGLNPGFQTAARFYDDTGEATVVMANLSGSRSSNFTVAVASRVLGSTSGSTKPSAGQLAQLWGGSAAALLIALSFGYWLVRRLSMPSKAVSSARALIWPVLLAVLSYVVAVPVPASSGATLAAARAFYPDLGLILTVIAGVLAVWAALHFALLARKLMKPREAR